MELDCAAYMMTKVYILQQEEIPFRRLDRYSVFPQVVTGTTAIRCCGLDLLSIGVGGKMKACPSLSKYKLADGKGCTKSALQGYIPSLTESCGLICASYGVHYKLRQWANSHSGGHPLRRLCLQ